MERSGNNKKRAREDDHSAASHVAKIKPDLINANGYSVHHEFETMDKQYRFNSIFDATETGYKDNNAAYPDVEEGLFNFPWLKEGMTFKAEDYVESDFDNIFASTCSSSSSTLQDSSGSKAEEQNLCMFPKILNFDDDDMKKKKKKTADYEDDLLLLPSFQADQLEGPDWICSCVFD